MPTSDREYAALNGASADARKLPGTLRAVPDGKRWAIMHGEGFIGWTDKREDALGVLGALMSDRERKRPRSVKFE